jgi:hypothetical protein
MHILKALYMAQECWDDTADDVRINIRSVSGYEARTVLEVILYYADSPAIFVSKSFYPFELVGENPNTCAAVILDELYFALTGRVPSHETD